MSDKTEALYLFFGLLTVFLLTLKRKNTDAHSEKTKEELLKIELDLSKVADQIKEEEKKQSALQKEMTEKTNETITPKDLADFFNNNKS